MNAKLSNYPVLIFAVLTVHLNCMNHTQVRVLNKRQQGCTLILPEIICGPKRGTGYKPALAGCKQAPAGGGFYSPPMIKGEIETGYKPAPAWVKFILN